MKRIMMGTGLAAALVLLWGLAGGAGNREARAASTETNAFDVLGKVVETWYDVDAEEVRRYSCYVECPELAKSVELRTKMIMTKVDYEMIWESGKSLKVKPRDVPDVFGRWAKADAGLYAGMLEKQLGRVFDLLDPIGDLMKVLDKVKPGESADVSIEKDGICHKITIAPKASAGRGHPMRRMLGGGRFQRWKRRPAPGRRPPARQGQPAKPMIIWVDRSNTVKKYEIHGGKGKSAGVIQPVKYRGKWSIKQLDLTQYDEEGRFDKRTLLTITHTYPKRIMLPSQIKIRELDKSGKLLERRNEVNPVSIKFKKYEIEKR